MHCPTASGFWLIEGVQGKKTPSDAAIFSQIVLYLLVKQKENLSLHQVSLKAIFRALLHLTTADVQL